VDGNAEIGNSLPVIVRGGYYEGWKPMKIATQIDPAVLSKRLLGLMPPRTVSADRQMSVTILKLLEDRLDNKLPARLAVALKVCTQDMFQMSLR
jgi:uncharacterized protein (DUF2267 family)